MKIIKASAGSGKTYRLSDDVVDLLLESSDPLAYREILAVTFTNKATDEMKERILRKLASRSESNPKAKSILIDILHDYSAFSVSTIDRFFQQTLKAFARELRENSNYQIELDRDSLIEEAMDRILDSLSEERKDVLEWVKGCVREMIEQGEKADFANRLHDLGKSLKSDDAAHDFSKERLDRMRSECRRVKADFHERVPAAAALLQDSLKGANAKKQLAEYLDKKPLWDTIEYPKSSLEKEFGDSEFGELFGRPYEEYHTILIIEKLLFTLGLAGEFYKEFNNLLKEKNVMCLDESNVLLKKIIDGSDAPFIYEKLGVRYKHFLLDEFQDTSRIQWENFLPLLRESESHADSRSLIVGDVKQSIYRWRNSDWRLLGNEVQEAFPAGDTEILESNWRSCRSIVEFNNDFFKKAAGLLGRSDIYSDVCQQVRCKDTQSGEVRVQFVEDELSAIVDSIADVRSRGARLGDIAILVRGHAEGTRIAARLLEEGIPVVSDDSLKVKSSGVVRKLCFQLESGELPECCHSIVDLCEAKLREIQAEDSETFSRETLYIQSFMDALRSWSEVNGNNVTEFVDWWKEQNPSIVSPESPGALRIITIHKSKGLQFPHVIFPFAQDVSLSGGSEKWCRLDTDGTGLNPVFNGSYPIRLSSSCERSLFDKYWKEECELQVTDALNLFYVALTRAEKSMHIICGEPSKSFKDSLDKDAPEFKNLSQVLYAVLDKSTDFHQGESYDFLKKDDGSDAEESEVSDIPSSYVSIPLSGRLVPSADSSDFFGDDGTAGTDASGRIAGIALHGILSEVNVISDLRPAIDRAVVSGTLESEHAEESFSLLSARIAEHPEWFSGKGLNEQAIIDSNGRERRPDRVVISGKSALIIDYKFGERDEEYESQIRRYERLYRELGFTDVRGIIWYVRSGEVVDIH